MHIQNLEVVCLARFHAESISLSFLLIIYVEER